MPKTPDAPAQKTSKKSDAPAQKSFAKDLEARVRQAADLPTVLCLLATMKGEEVPLGSLIALLSSLATKAATAGRGSYEEAVMVGQSMVESAISLNGGQLSEAVVHSMVRLFCAAGSVSRAMDLVAEAQTKNVKLRLRVLTAILGQAADVQDVETCERVWAMMSTFGFEPQDTEYAAMLRGLRGDRERQRRLLLQMPSDLPLPSDPPLIEEIGRFFGVENAVALHDNDPPSGEGREESGRRWRVGWTSVDAEGTCALTSRRLRALDISGSEVDDLSDLAARLACNGPRNSSFRRFKQWLQEQEPYDVIVDGANVGFSGQNHDGGHFQYAQIDAVVRKLRDAGLRVLLVLHPKWLLEDADLTVVKRKKRRLAQVDISVDAEAEEEDPEMDQQDEDLMAFPCEHVTDAERSAAPNSPLRLVKDWKEWGVLLRAPWHDCDDWYWLYAALYSQKKGLDGVQVVSNDLMRDHHWRMIRPRAFERWQDRHMTRVIMCPEQLDAPKDAEGKEVPTKYTVSLIPPRPFSTSAQVSIDGEAWHFPVPAVQSRAEQLASGRPVSNRELKAAEHRWLVAWLQ